MIPQLHNIIKLYGKEIGTIGIAVYALVLSSGGNCQLKQAEIAEMIGKSRWEVCRAICHMQRLGLLQMTRDQDDGRRKSIRLGRMEWGGCVDYPKPIAIIATNYNRNGTPRPVAVTAEAL
jgi:hypothetical protein